MPWEGRGLQGGQASVRSDPVRFLPFACAQVERNARQDPHYHEETAQKNSIYDRVGGRERQGGGRLGGRGMI